MSQTQTVTAKIKLLSDDEAARRSMRELADDTRRAARAQEELNRVRQQSRSTPGPAPAGYGVTDDRRGRADTYGLAREGRPAAAAGDPRALPLWVQAERDRERMQQSRLDAADADRQRLLAAAGADRRERVLAGLGAQRQAELRGQEAASEHARQLKLWENPIKAQPRPGLNADFLGA